MSEFDSIRHYHDSEVNEVLQKISKHPMVKTLMAFTFPEKTEELWIKELSEINSIQEFQEKFVYYSILRILEKSSNGLTASGFDKLSKDQSYLYISNHRDILMDTSLLNVVLKENNLTMTASAVGDNLVKKNILLALAKVNRNFLVRRDLPARELLESSKVMSSYIHHLLAEENRSVWIAQREGRAKDGNDATHQGVLKMIGMDCQGVDLMDYFKSLRIAPVSISYEYDPTDAMKMPQLLAKANDTVYVKDKNEDFLNIYSGIIGQKKGIHIHVGKVLDTELDEIKATESKPNKQLQALAQLIDNSIISNYHLWPTNYIAYDIVHNTNRFTDKYTEKERELFERRLQLRVDKENKIVVDGFLAMYSNPVVNKLKLQDEQ